MNQADTRPGAGLPGIAQLRTIVGAVMTIGLILSVLALIISAIIWGWRPFRPPGRRSRRS
jgi:hypothetical protein